MAKAKWVSEETPEVGNESFGGIIAFGITLALAVIISKGIGWIFKKLEEGVKKLGEKIEKHKEATTDINGYVLELKKREPHLKEVLAKLHKPVSVMTKDQILQMLTSMVDNKYHEVLTHLNDRVLKSPEAIAAIALMCHNTVEPGYLKRIVNNPQFAKEPLIYGFIANSGLKVYATLSWHDGMYRNQGTKLSKVAMDIAARLTTIYKGAEKLVDGPYVLDPLRKYLRKHKSEIESLYKKADTVWNEVSNLYYDKSYIIDAHEKDYDTIDVFNKDALTLGHVLCDLSTIEHILQAETAGFNTFKEKAQFLYNLNFAKSSLQSHELDLDSKDDQDSETYEVIETLLGTMYAMVHTLGYVGYEHEYASEEILGASQHVLACYNALDKIVAKLESKVPSVALEGWFSSKPKHSETEELQKHIDDKLAYLLKYTQEKHVIENYQRLHKLVTSVKMSPSDAKQMVCDHVEESYEDKIEKLPISEFSSTARAYALMIVTTSPCQEDYDNDYVCLQRIIKSRAFASHPILTAIGSQCGHVAPDLYYLSNGKLNQFLDKAIQLTKSSSDNELDELYKDFCQDIQFDGWGYCYEDSESFERYNGLKLLESLSNAVPKQLLEQYRSKVVELIKVDGGKGNKTVVSFAHSTLSLIEMAKDWYQCLHEYCGFCLRLLEKVAKEAFADFASETQQVTDFANRYRDEHMLDESYHKINIDAKGSISHQAWISEKGIGNMYEQIDDVPMLDFVALESEGWAGVANQEVQDEDLGMSDLLDMESDTEDFDIEMDNETLGVDDLEDYVSNDVEPAQTEVAVGLEHYGELIATKGMCKEYYVACESLQPGIFSGIQQNRLTALPSRTMQAVALEAVEGEQKKGLIARLIEKIKQFFKWVLSKLGIGVGTVKGKDANGKEVEVEYDSTVHAEVMDEAVAEIIRQAEDLKKKHEEIKPSKSSHFDTLHVSTPAQRLARDILSKHYKSTGAALIVKKINQCPAWNKYPVEVAGVLLTGSCYIVKDNEYIDRGIASIEEHMALIMKVSSMIKDGTIDKWDSSEALDVNRIDNQNIYKDSLESILVINEVNLNKFTGGVLENRNITKIGKAIEKYTTYSKELKEKVAHAKEAFDHISNSPEAATDIVLNSLSSLFAFTMQSINNVNGIVRQHTHALLMQERWIRRLIKLVKKTKATPATESFIGWAQPAPVPQSWCIPAMEAIDFQYKSKLFTRLTKWCAELRMAKNFTSKALAESDIGKIIEEETNLQFIFKIDPEQEENAAVMTVQLDRNNPIYTNFLHDFLDNDELLRAKSLLGNTIEGLIDYQKGKVGGVFAKVKNTMWLAVGLVKSKLLTDEEVAAAICHEIGHTFTIFSQIASIVSLNYIIDDLSKRVLGTNDRKVQISILHEYDTKYGIKLPEDEILATTDNKQKFVTKVVTDVVKRSRNVEGDYVFSMRNCELAADQFAARMGAGRHIVSGLNKMYATWGHMQYQSKGVHYTIQAFTVLTTALLSTAGIIITPLLPILIIFGLVMDRPQEKVYDEPMQRFTRIRNEYIAALKQVGLSREMKSVYLDDIQAMDKIISAMNKNVGWLEWVWVNWIPSGKRTAKAEAYQQLIERMGNNDLFMKSASYELLIEDLKNA